ncbi:MAG: hypothetical protein LAN70_02115 [Acidobacteriia bacterium]|nr:hypothetical protein [Terriglobia bacterium]
MPTYEPQHILVRNLLLTANRQNAYATPVPDANLLEHCRFDGQAFASIVPSFWDDGALSGLGHEFPTVRQNIKWDSSLQLSRHVDEWFAGWMLAQVLQEYSVTNVGAVYTHVFKPLSTTRQAKPTTVYFEDSAAIKYRMPDLVGVELTVTIPDSGPVTAQISLTGSGRWTDGALGNAMPAVSARTLLLGSDADVLIGASGAAASIKPRLRQCQFKITRTIEIHRAQGGGMYAVQANVDQQRASFSIVVRAIATEDGAEPRTLMIANTLREVQINVNSGASAQMKIKFPNAYVKTTPVMDGKYLSWQIDASDQDLVKVGAAEIIEATVINGQATYLVGA